MSPNGSSDIFPGINAGHSCGATHQQTRSVTASTISWFGMRATGADAPPQDKTANPAARIFIAPTRPALFTTAHSRDANRNSALPFSADSYKTRATPASVTTRHSTRFRHGDLELADLSAASTPIPVIQDPCLSPRQVTPI
jgi:hypothetical protein